MGYLITSMLLLALNNVIWKYMVSHSNPLAIMVKRALLTSSIGIFILAVFFREILDYDSFNEFMLISFTCTVGFLGLLMMLNGLKDSNLSHFLHYSLLSGIFVGSWLLFVENQFTNRYVIGVGLVLSGFFLFYLNRRHDSATISSRTHFQLFMMSLCFALSGILQWYHLKTHEPLLLVIHQEVVVFLLAAGTTWVFRIKRIPVFNADKIPLMAIIIFLALLCGMLGLKETDPLIANIIGLFTPVTTILLGSLMLKEKLAWSSLLSLVLMLCGAYFLK